MAQPISLKEAEAKVYRAAVQDGLWDVFIGCVILMFAIGPFLTPSLGDFWGSAVFVPFWLLAYLVIWAIRKHVVAPRVGVVKFGSARKAILLKFNAVVFVVLLAGLLLGILSASAFDVMPGWMHAASFGVMILATFSVAAYYLDLRYLYVYGALIAVAPLAGEWLWLNMKVPHHGFPVTFGATAAIMILAGLFKFARLLRDNPVPEANSPTEEQ